MGRKRKVKIAPEEIAKPAGFWRASGEAPVEMKKARSWIWWILLVIALAGLMFVLFGRTGKAQATNPCEKFCADQRWWGCADEDYRLCHNNPSQSITHEFNNSTSCNNHVGTPHSPGTYDTYGSCPVPTSTPTPTPEPTAEPTATPTPTSEPTATPTPTETPQQCEQSEWSCGECQKLQDNVCYEDQQKYCGEEFSCDWVEVCETNGELKVSENDCHREWTCKDTCEEPTPTPTPEQRREEPKPSGCTGDCSAPAPTCGSANTTKEPANFHVYRKGDTALLKWWATEGNQVHAYWKLVEMTDWQHSTTAGNSGYLEINNLGSADWTFGLQQVNDCGGGLITAGNIVSVEDGATAGWILFR